MKLLLPMSSLKIFLAFHALLIVAFAGNHDSCLGDDLLLRRCFAAWSEYEQVRFTGVARRYEGEKVVEEMPFTANYGRGANGNPPPYEIGHRVPNPGEPHIADPEVFIEAIAEVDNMTLHFNRRFITTPPVSERRSEIVLSQINGAVYPFALIRRAILGGIDSSEPKGNAGNVETAVNRCSLEQLGTESIFGFDAARVRLMIPTGSGQYGETPPLEIESLLALQPTLQVLKIDSVNGGPPGWLERDGNREQYMVRKVESARVIEKWLVCDRVRFPTLDGSWLIEITGVERLPEDYVGLWDYNKVTGVVFGGPSEMGTRKGSPRLAFTHTKAGSYIPFTKEEQEKIRQFVIAQASPAPQRIAWSRVAFWIMNMAAILLLVYVGYRRYRFG